MDTVTQDVAEWGAAERALDAGGESGDRYLVKPFAHGVLVAAADGLGHGPEAAVAARTAMAILEANADQPVTTLLQRCHEHLRSTRGAALSLASFNAQHGTMTWLGVGNVDGVVLRAEPAAGSLRLVMLAGVVGRQLPSLHSSVVRVVPGDTLVIVTDGIRDDFAERLSANGAVGPLAERILARHAKGTDDALVLVVRYKGGDVGESVDVA